MSVVSSEQFATFHATHYRVHAADAPFTLRIGAYSAALQRLQQAQDAESSAFLTAWNPLGQLAAPHLNSAYQTALQRDLDVMGVACIPGEGVDPATGWAEESVLAVGLSRDKAIALGTKYRQLAIVFNAQDAAPELILLN